MSTPPVPGPRSTTRYLGTRRAGCAGDPRPRVERPDRGAGVRLAGRARLHRHPRPAERRLGHRPACRGRPGGARSAAGAQLRRRRPRARPGRRAQPPAEGGQRGRAAARSSARSPGAGPWRSPTARGSACPVRTPTARAAPAATRSSTSPGRRSGWSPSCHAGQSPVLLWGYSEGGRNAAWAAELHPTYAAGAGAGGASPPAVSRPTSTRPPRRSTAVPTAASTSRSWSASRTPTTTRRSGRSSASDGLPRRAREAALGRRRAGGRAPRAAGDHTSRDEPWDDAGLARGPGPRAQRRAGPAGPDVPLPRDGRRARPRAARPRPGAAATGCAAPTSPGSRSTATDHLSGAHQAPTRPCPGWASAWSSTTLRSAIEGWREAPCEPVATDVRPGPRSAGSTAVQPAAACGADRVQHRPCRAPGAGAPGARATARSGPRRGGRVRRRLRDRVRRRLGARAVRGDRRALAPVRPAGPRLPAASRGRRCHHHPVPVRLPLRGPGDGSRRRHAVRGRPGHGPPRARRLGSRPASGRNGAWHFPSRASSRSERPRTPTSSST